MTIYKPLNPHWATIVKDVEYIVPALETDPVHYYATVPWLDDNDVGAGELNVGFYLKDFIGSVYEIVAINVGADPLRIEVVDNEFTGAGPQSGQNGYVYQSIDGGNAPNLAPVKYQRLDESAFDPSRAIDMEVQWKHRGFKEETNNKDNITAIVLGAGFVSSVEEGTGWRGGRKLFLSAQGSHNPLTIALGSASRASIDINQELTVEDQPGDAQIQSDWNQAVNTALDYIKGKPTFDLPFEWCISAGVAQTENVDIYASRPYKIKLFIAESDGTLTSVSIKIDGVSVTGLNALSVSALASFAATALNSVTAGQRVTIVFGTGYSGTPTKLRGKLIIEV